MKISSIHNFASKMQAALSTRSIFFPWFYKILKLPTQRPQQVINGFTSVGGAPDCWWSCHSERSGITHRISAYLWGSVENFTSHHVLMNRKGPGIFNQTEDSEQSKNFKLLSSTKKKINWICNQNALKLTTEQKNILSALCVLLVISCDLMISVLHAKSEINYESSPIGSCSSQSWWR